MRTPSEEARLARAELEAIVAGLRVNELAVLVALGRRMLDRDPEEDLGERPRRGNLR
ncbi:MAG: hypothetical protein IT379_40695 [Deltaproteobacteria bacterium]|nr:hypothetical protein [Deltaproteobacteria bacterium]